MLHPKSGQTMLWVVPPEGHTEGFAQDGVVSAVTETEFTLAIRIDGSPRMAHFSRKDGRHKEGLGFAVRSPYPQPEPASSRTGQAAEVSR